MSDLKQLAEKYSKGLDRHSGDERMLAKVKARFFEQVVAASAASPPLRVSGYGRWFKLWLPLAASAAAAAVLLFVFAFPRAPLGVVVRDHADQSPDFVLASREERALDFSDGSEVVVRPDSQLRVHELTADGASATLEHGSAHISVVHHGKTKWTFMAGPYRVHVVGTRFELQWNPQTEGIRVKMEEGVVEVDGPGMARRRVTSGDTLDIAAVPPTETAEVPELPNDVETPDARKPRVHHAKAQAPMGTAPLATPPWRYFANMGDAMGAYSAAEQAGFSSLAGSMPQTDVLLLGDVASKAHHPDRAKEAYLAVRDRFPGSPASIEAALRMGRMLTDVTHDDARAAWWYEHALREGPNAGSAPEAMGRWLEVLTRTNKTAARDVARDYLRRFPNGDDAQLARDVMR